MGEDHHRFAITEEEWTVRAPELIAEWIAPVADSRAERPVSELVPGRIDQPG